MFSEKNAFCQKLLSYDDFDVIFTVNFKPWNFVSKVLKKLAEGAFD